MTRTISAAVTATEGEFRIQELELGELQPNEVLVRMKAVGICHSDLTARDSMTVPKPIVLGHEGAGIIEEVGTGVTGVQAGDHVVLAFDSCGECDECYRGRSYQCMNSPMLNLFGNRSDFTSAYEGTDVQSHFFGQSSFSTYAIVDRRCLVVIPHDVDFGVAAAMACGAATGAGAVSYGLRPEPGEAMAVFGAGGVGLSAMMAARLCGCATLIAVDRYQNRLDLAMELGATHTVLADGRDVAAEIMRIVPLGLNFAIETTAVPAVVETGIAVLRPGGTLGQIGVTEFGTMASFDITAVSLSGIGIRGFPAGAFVPQIQIPRLIELHRQGRFPIDKMITTFPFAEIDRAADEMLAGRAIKPILVFDN